MILATNNKGKLREIKEILDEYEITSLKENNIDIDVIEDEDSFYLNAKKKAKEIYDIAKIPVIADDSGLSIDELDGFPGVMTHRFLGEGKTDEERNEYLIEKMKNYENRSAKVICDLVYYDGKDIINAEGVLEGFISEDRRGNNGFGFDEIFELPDGRTLAELTSEEKNTTSARYIAAKELKKKLKKHLN